MRVATRFLSVITAAALTFGVGAAVVPATAAPAGMATATAVKNTVTITKLANKKVAYGKKATYKPAVKTTGKIKVTSKTLTVKQGTKTLYKNKSSVALKAGTYKITSTVKYKVGTVKTTTTKYWAAGTSNYLVDDTDVTCKITKWTEDDYWDEYEWESVCTDVAGNKYLTSGDDWGEYEYWVTSTSPSKYAVGGTWSGTLEGDQNVPQAVEKSKNTSTTTYGATKTKTLTQTIKVTQGAKPNWVWGTGGYNCPAGYPVKGNQSGIYHVKGGAFYSRTKPEQCFTTAAAARAAGYRASKR